MIRGKALEDISLGDYVDCILDEKTGFLMVRKARPESTEREKVEKEMLNKLLFHVERKFPGETRFETALRYIKEAERPKTNCQSKEFRPPFLD